MIKKCELEIVVTRPEGPEAGSLPARNTDAETVLNARFE
jgi:hypothetical protein